MQMPVFLYIHFVNLFPESVGSCLPGTRFVENPIHSNS